MAKYLSNRQKNLKVGIVSYTESNTVLEVTGKVGIGTTLASADLDVNGSTRIRGALYDRTFNAGVANQVLVSTGTQVEWSTITTTGALTGITVKDEGSTVSASVNSLNFVGSNVTATASGAGATITISDIGYVSNAGVSTFATTAGTSTSVIGGIASVTQLNVSGVSTLGTVRVSSGIVTATSGVVTYYGDGSKLTGIVVGNTDYSNNAGIATYATTAGIATYATNAGIATYATSSGIATYATTAGIATYATNAGIATYATTAGIATYATNAGTSTSVIGGIASVTQLNVSGISTLGIASATNLYVAGIGTFLSSGLKIRNPANTFEYSITGGAIVANRTLNLPVITATDTVATLGLSQTFSNSITFSSTLTASSTLDLTGSTTGAHVFGTNQTTGSITLGGSSATGSITFGRSTNTQTTNIQAGATVSTGVKTINFGTGGLSGSFTQINIGPTAGVGTVAINSGSNLGIGSTTPTSKLDVIGDAKFTGVVTATSFSGNASSATYATSAGIATYATAAGIATYATNAGIATYATNAGVATYATNAGIATYATAAGIATYATNAGIATYATNAGIATYATNAGIATYATTAGVATALQNARTFEITGDIVASPISFNGTGNVSLAATIQPNSVGLGTDTFGDYVKSISGTSNQITVTGGTGEGSTPTLSIPNQFTVPQDLTVLRDVQIDRNLNVNGNITIGGTSATIFSQTLNVYDPDIVLGFRTDGLGNDVSNDNTANHGGVAIASTEGTPLVQLFIAGIETNPATYKKIMWFKAGEFAGLGTDAWLANYAIGIGSTQFPSGTRLAAGAVQITERDLAVVRNINASGIITGSLANTLTLNTSGTGLSGSTTYNNSGAATFTVTSNATSNNTPSTIVARDGSGNFSAGTITANLTGTASTASFATTAFNLTDAANITAGTINSARLSGTYNISINGNAATATYATSAGIATYATNAGIATYATTAGIATYATNAGIATYATNAGIATYATNAGVATYATSAGIATYATNAGTSTSVIGGIASVTQLTVSGISTFNNNVFIGTGITMYASTGIISATAFYGNGQNLTDLVAAKLSGISVREENTLLGTEFQFSELKFIGDYVTATGIGSTATITFTTPAYATAAGIATYATNAGVATYATAAGIATYATTAGIATYATNAGIATYATNAGVATYATSSGIATYSTTSGIATYATTAGVSTSVIGGIGSITQLQVTGVSTFTNGPVLVGSGTSTGTASQRLQVTGGGYFSDNVGIGTTNPSSKLTIDGAVQIQQDSGSNNRIIFRGQPGSSYRWNIDNYSSSNEFRIFREDDATAANGSVAVSISTTGTVTATKFSGDGSLLTNITASSTPAGSDGQVQYNNGGSTGGASNLYYDDVNNRVGVATSSPTSLLEVGAVGASGTSLTVNGNSRFVGVISATSIQAEVSITNSGNVNANRNVLLATTTSGNSPIIGDLDLTYNTITNILTSGSFSGSGSLLTNLNASNVSSGTLGTARLSGTYDINISGIATYATTSGVSTSVIGGIASVSQLNVSGISTVTNITGTNLNYTGVSTITDIRTNTNINSSGIHTAQQFVGNINAGVGTITNITGTNLNYTGVSTITNIRTITGINASGIITAQQFIGNINAGVGTITNITGTNLNYTGVSTITDIRTNTNINSSGIHTAQQFIGNISAGVGTITNITGTNLNYTGISTVTNVTGTNLNYTGVSTITDIRTNTNINSSGIHTAQQFIGNINAGVGTITNITGTNLNYTGVSTITDIRTNTNINSSGIHTAQQFVGNISAGVGTITNITGTNLNYTGVSTITNIRTITGINASGIITAQQFVGNISAGVGTITNITGTNLNYTGVSTITDIRTNTNINSSGIHTAQQFVGNINAGVGTITNITGTNLNYIGVATFLNGPVLIGAATSTGTSGQDLQVTGNAYISGNTGIGTTNPARILDIYSASSSNTVKLTANGTSAGFIVDSVGVSSRGGYFSAHQGGVQRAIFGVSGTIEGNTTSDAAIFADGTGGNIRFYTNGSATERARFDASGNLGIGITNPTQKLHVQGDVRITGGIYDSNNLVGAAGSILSSTGSGLSWISNAQTSTTVSTASTDANLTHYMTFVVDNNTSAASEFLRTDAGVTYNPSTNDLTVSGAVTANSDERLKTNIKTIENALDKVNALRGVEFDMIETGKHNIGVIAQEVEKILPDLVSENSHGIKSVAYANMVGLLIEAIKEQQVQIEDLKQKLLNR